jgi:hypothetical protein
MARIENTERYPYDESVSADDYLIGTDAENSLRTSNYKISDVLNLGAPEFVERTSLPFGVDMDPTFSDSTVSYTKYGRVVTIFFNITISAAPTTGSGLFDAPLPENFRPYQQVRVSIGNDIYSGESDGFIFVTVDNFGNIGIQNNGLYTGNFLGTLTYVAEENSSS